MRRYVTYRRVSSQEQGKSGLGLEAQARDIQLFLDNYAETPYEMVGDFVEIHSGADNDRSQLNFAIALARKTGAVLVVAKLDRLSRRVSFLASLMEEKGMDFKVAQMPYADRFQLHIYAALAEQERAFISERTVAALQAAKERGVRLGAPVHHIDALAIAKKQRALENAQKVKGVIVPLRHSSASLRTICGVLNTSGARTSKGGIFYPPLVSQMLRRLEAAA